MKVKDNLAYVDPVLKQRETEGRWDGDRFGFTNLTLLSVQIDNGFLFSFFASGSICVLE